MNTKQLRQKFIDYFIEHAHTWVPSSPLIPANDPTLLFTNAGMVQFKDVFLGLEKPHYTRAVSCQRCVRAGGKHNDLDNVGYTARHHTFFEMLGNFSFGDYFKKEAIKLAWEFLTQELKIPKEKLWITVHISDQEAEDIWLKEIGVDPKRFSRCDEDNFWSMGDVGPCGPCTEIFYDHGEQIAGGPPGSPDAEGDRYVEIWNLVFMQFNREADGTMTALPKPSVDTGMGLERIAAVMQGVHSNYDIDLFKTLIAEIAKIAETQQVDQPSLRVIADHIRSTSFLIADGVRPSNEGRGYVLRRIIRRAVRHGYKLGIQQAFLYRLVKPLVALMGEAYPELAQQQNTVEKVLLQEEQQFSHTLAQGLKIFQQALSEQKNQQIPGDVIFKLYDTYGFPVDLCADMAREQGLSLDLKGFDACMEQQRQQSQAHSQFTRVQRLPLEHLPATEFMGYTQLQNPASILAILQHDQFVETLHEGQEGIIILNQTPFYPEGGGQVGDVGDFRQLNTHFRVENTTKQDNIILHHGKLLQGSLSIHHTVETQVDENLRQATRLNHSATHLLHAALRKVLGVHVIQKGSLVSPDYLRFDFAHFAPVTPAEMIEIEKIVNHEIRANTEVEAEWLDKTAALQRGAMALFEEKYGEQVRVLTMGENFSVELCGGTHVSRTGDIGLFKITQETGIAAGVRRIEAVTGAAAFQYVLDLEKQAREIAGLLKSTRDQSVPKLQQLFERNKDLEKELERAHSKLVRSALHHLINQAESVGEIKVIAAQLPDVDRKSLKEAVEQLQVQLPHSIICLATIESGQIALICAVDKKLSQQFPANQLLQSVTEQLSGKGGGKADMAQGSGSNIGALPKALASVKEWVKNKIE